MCTESNGLIFHIKRNEKGQFTFFSALETSNNRNYLYKAGELLRNVRVIACLCFICTVIISIARIFISLLGYANSNGILIKKEVGLVKKVKITVLKTTLDRELAKEYGAEGLTACPMLMEGQVFYADYAKPDGFCDEAWKAIYQYVFALSHGADKELFYYGDWIRKPGIAICSCNDGLRPVIFKLEATDENSQVDYIPVR